MAKKAKGKKRAKKPKKALDRWVEQAVIVKKTHPYGTTEDQAREVAERHAGRDARTVFESARARRFIMRPKECCERFRNQARGAHVTVTWCKLTSRTARRKVCK